MPDAPECECKEPAECRRCPFAMQRIAQLEAELKKYKSIAVELATHANTRIAELEADVAHYKRFLEAAGFNLDLVERSRSV